MKIDILNKWLTAVQSVFIIVGVGVALWQLLEISAQTRLQAQTLKQAQKTASAGLVLKLRRTLDDKRYDDITGEIQNHDHIYHLLVRADGGKGDGKYRDLDIERYIGNFEDMGYLIQEGLIDEKMAYNHFSYDIEKTWCNDDIRQIIGVARKDDKSSAAASDPFYGNFERLARQYLAKENQTCKNLDNQ